MEEVFQGKKSTLPEGHLEPDREVSGNRESGKHEAGQMRGKAHQTDPSSRPKGTTDSVIGPEDVPKTAQPAAGLQLQHRTANGSY